MRIVVVVQSQTDLLQIVLAGTATRGFTRLYQQHVTQAHEGCDFDFLMGTAPTPEPDIF